MSCTSSRVNEGLAGCSPRVAGAGSTLHLDGLYLLLVPLEELAQALRTLVKVPSLHGSRLLRHQPDCDLPAIALHLTPVQIVRHAVVGAVLVHEVFLQAVGIPPSVAI